MSAPHEYSRERIERRIHVFSNGSQWYDWKFSNCDRCTKSDQWSPEGDIIKETECEILKACFAAQWDDGSFDLAMAQRIGAFDEDGNDRRLYCWQCPEVEWTDEWKREWRERHPEETGQKVMQP